MSAVTYAESSVAGRHKAHKDTMSLKDYLKKQEHPEVEVDLKGDIHVNSLLTYSSAAAEERENQIQERTNQKAGASTHLETRDQPENHPPKKMSSDPSKTEFLQESVASSLATLESGFQELLTATGFKNTPEVRQERDSAHLETRDQPENHPSKKIFSDPSKKKSLQESVASSKGQALVTATVFKNTPDTKTGLKLMRSRGKVIISGIVAGGLFANTPLQFGDEIVAINNVHPKSQNAKKLANIIRKAEFVVTILAKRNTSESNNIQRQQELVAAQQDSGCSIWTTADTVAYWNLGDSSPGTADNPESECTVCDPVFVDLVHGGTSHCYYCFDVMMNLGSGS